MACFKVPPKVSPKRAKRHRQGARYTLVSPSRTVTFGTLFGTVHNGDASYLMFRIDRRGLK